MIEDWLPMQIELKFEAHQNQQKVIEKYLSKSLKT